MFEQHSRPRPCSYVFRTSGQDSTKPKPRRPRPFFSFNWKGSRNLSEDRVLPWEVRQSTIVMRVV